LLPPEFITNVAAKQTLCLSRGLYGSAQMEHVRPFT